DAPGRGLALLSPSALRDAAQAHRARGFDLAIHAIGDAAASAVLDLYEALDLRGGRLEHAQLLSEPDLDRLARSGTVASIQPLHYVDDAEMAPRRLGPERFAQAYPWRRLVARGAPILLGSDAPIASADPRRGLWAALSRSDGEALSPTTALRAYTVGPLHPGDPADLLLWGVNPLTAPPSALLDAPLEGVWVGGARRG
ncbi:amidohydrolase family protein, partial [Myxococcota bacterium]|nr:amidohydrolase family protein [Myxococcota bacterium]